jgi:hypothetical protein
MSIIEAVFVRTCDHFFYVSDAVFRLVQCKIRYLIVFWWLQNPARPHLTIPELNIYNCLQVEYMGGVQGFFFNFVKYVDGQSSQRGMGQIWLQVRQDSWFFHNPAYFWRLTGTLNMATFFVFSQKDPLFNLWRI